jgi:hypothetical protein
MSLGYQLFAHRIDGDLQRLLCQYASAVGEGISPFAFSNNTNGFYKPECEAIVSLSYYFLSFMCNKPTPGMRVANLTLNDQRKQKPKVLMMCICFAWLFQRATFHAMSQGLYNFLTSLHV